ncbi:MAG TPA: serine hydrolase domain-containing protein [Longimicrobium sp.]|nr:serine hydrolase domain-containing protein [Longimicrobium sp.]
MSTRSSPPTRCGATSGRSSSTPTWGWGCWGHILERVTGRGYEDLVRERILRPLGMGMTAITPNAEMAAWMTHGHNARGGVTPPWDVALGGMGGLRSNARDMLTFLAANTGPAASDLERAMRDTHQPRRAINARADVGLNWYVRKDGDRRIVYHTGATGGFRTMVAFDPELAVGVVLLSNAAQLTDLNLVFDLIHPPAPEVQVAPEVLRAYVGSTSSRLPFPGW